MATRSSLVAGIDRWRGGWVIAHGDGARPESLSLIHADTVEDALEVTADCVAVTIDMPIALPIEGRREAEVLLREFLGSAGRSVFYSPTRAALAGKDRADADRINRSHGGPGMSAQGWGLAGSIREVRTALTAAEPNVRRRWWETHPETAFTIMNEAVPLASKRSALGVGQRLELLRPWCSRVDELLLDAPEKVPVDDVLDAVVAAWSATRLVADEGRLFGERTRDDQDFAIGVWV